MFKTSQFELPLLAEGQAQKHVTVNDALARLDAVSQLRIASRSLGVAPLDAVDGTCYFVPEGATGLWGEHASKLVFWSNGGWASLSPKQGWQAWIEDEAIAVRFNGADWIEDVPPVPQGVSFEKLDILQAISAGPEVTTADVIPAHSWVLSVAHRVTQEIITDGPTGWLLGHQGDKDQWGSGKPLNLDASGIGGTGKRMFYFNQDTPLCLSLNNGSFISGEVLLRVFYITLDLP